MSSLATFTAFLDADVLYSALVRDLLMNLTNTDLFRPKWSRAVQDEWITNLLENRLDLRPEQLERTRELMDRHAPDALVAGYEDLIEGLQLPDPDDRHVLAAAIRGVPMSSLPKISKTFPSRSSPILESSHSIPMNSSFVSWTWRQAWSAGQPIITGKH